MKYIIISIDDNRAAYKDAIRSHLSFDELPFSATKGVSVGILGELRKRNLRPSRGWIPKVGEAGCWCSHYDAWQLASTLIEPLIVFEDDAILVDGFEDKLLDLMVELPPSWDYMSLWVPDNQHQDFNYNIFWDANGMPKAMFGTLSNDTSIFNYSDKLATVYQGYGMVATMYSPSGAAKLLSSVHRYGLYAPVDCFVSIECHANRIDGFAPKPWHQIINYDWSQKTTIHDTENIDAI